MNLRFPKTKDFIITQRDWDIGGNGTREVSDQRSVVGNFSFNVIQYGFVFVGLPKSNMSFFLRYTMVSDPVPRWRGPETGDGLE